MAAQVGDGYLLLLQENRDGNFGVIFLIRLIVTLSCSVFMWGNYVVQVGNGNRIRFWNDHWIGEKCFKEEFSRIFELSMEKEASLDHMVERKKTTSRWDMRFSRKLRAWEELEVDRLIELLNSSPSILVNKADTLVWKASQSGMFNVAVAYNKITSGQDFDVSGFIWKNISPPKLNFFCWLVLKGRIKSRAYLQRLGILSHNARSECVFCTEEIETINHVMLLCPVIWQLWSNLLE
ncbi:unnamed protein product [Camellia sinensis]